MADDTRIGWAVGEMQRRMAEPLSIDALANSVNLSRSRFAHLFRHHIGMAPGRYLRDLRLNRARELLDNSFLSVKEVMAAVGFNDPSHFSRDFHEKFGAGPREWRKRGGRSRPDFSWRDPPSDGSSRQEVSVPIGPINTYGGGSSDVNGASPSSAGTSGRANGGETDAA